MHQSSDRDGEDRRPRVIAADMPIDTSRYPIEPLLNAFAGLARTDPRAKLLLSGKRCPDEIYSVWNYLDKHDLVDQA
ncbi:MAG: hypothetical protein WD114_02725, partial [Phycisphaerales bacterium]